MKATVEPKAKSAIRNILPIFLALGIPALFIRPLIDVRPLVLYGFLFALAALISVYLAYFTDRRALEQIDERAQRLQSTPEFKARHRATMYTGFAFCIAAAISWPIVTHLIQELHFPSTETYVVSFLIAIIISVVIGELVAKHRKQ